MFIIKNNYSNTSNRNNNYTSINVMPVKGGTGGEGKGLGFDTTTLPWGEDFDL